ncbi:MAG: alkaline phosphatase PhoX [Candidatus Latescibacterota bacterium]|nr:alkaline phosphatase PhoX [Candidatus Latescibacterota bacterium]
MSLGFHGLQRCVAHAAGAKALAIGYGPLVPDPHGLLDLPAGFSYRMISRAGLEMADGFLVPGAQDGMAAFPGPNGRTILICNHELLPNASNGPFGATKQRLSRIDPAAVYDFGRGREPCLGGTTTLVYDEATCVLERQFLSLAGTVRNCAGGPTPWGSWISCEETIFQKSRRPSLIRGQRKRNRRPFGYYEQDHGFNFEVPTTTEISLTKPVPLKQMGRFNHEAVAVDPRTSVVYQTEDRDDGLLYRYIPDEPGHLAEGGRLQAMAIRDQPQLITSNWEATTVSPGQPHPVRWIDIEEVEAPGGDNLRHQGFNKGAAQFTRGEGMWYGHDAIYFACTTGGVARLGQVWRYRPSPAEGSSQEDAQPGILELFVEPNDPDLLRMCDTITVAPWGDLILCEDATLTDAAGVHPKYDRLIGVTPRGQLYSLARNALIQNELAGVVFSPSGLTMFVNVQTPGLTYAITGPWHRPG